MFSSGHRISCARHYVARTLSERVSHRLGSSLKVQNLHETLRKTSRGESTQLSCKIANTCARLALGEEGPLVAFGGVRLCGWVRLLRTLGESPHTNRLLSVVACCLHARRFSKLSLTHPSAVTAAAANRLLWAISLPMFNPSANKASLVRSTLEQGLIHTPQLRGHFPLTSTALIFTLLSLFATLLPTYARGCCLIPAKVQPQGHSLP